MSAKNSDAQPAKTHDYAAIVARMSDQAIRYQLAKGAPGGAQRAATVTEARARGIL